MPSPRRTPPAENADPAEQRSQPRPAPYELPLQPGTIRAERRGHADPVTAEPERSPVVARRAGTPGATKVPRPLPGLQLQPLVHVDDMAKAVAFYEKLGGELNHGDRSGEWVLMQLGTAQIGLVTRPPNAAHGEGTVELNFTAIMPLDRLEQLLREQGVTVVTMTTDRDLGTQLHVETPEGMPIKIHQVEPELLV